MGFSHSTVYASHYKGYNHGEVFHEKKTEKTALLSEITERVLNMFPFETLVNPSKEVVRLALKKSPPIRRVFFNVANELREEVETAFRQEWREKVTVVDAPQGLSFVGREGTQHSHVAKEWVALGPVLGSVTQYENDSATLVEVRYDKVRKQHYSYNNPFFLS